MLLVSYPRLFEIDEGTHSMSCVAPQSPALHPTAVGPAATNGVMPRAPAHHEDTARNLVTSVVHYCVWELCPPGVHATALLRAWGWRRAAPRVTAALHSVDTRQSGVTVALEGPYSCIQHALRAP